MTTAPPIPGRQLRDRNSIGFRQWVRHAPLSGVHRHPATARLDIALEIDGGQNRVVLGVDGRPIDVEDGRGLLLLATQDFEQRIDLFVGGTVIDHRQIGALAFMDRPRPLVLF